MEYTQAKVALDDIYIKYSENKHSNQDKITVVELLCEIAVQKEIDLSLVVLEIFRFSSKISKLFFAAVSEKFSPDEYEALLKAMLNTALASKDLSSIATKLSLAVSEAITHYNDAAYSMSVISEIVFIIVDNSLKTNGNFFDSVLKSTEGKILSVDYSSLNKNKLDKVKKCIDVAIENDTKAQYQDCINNWNKKYNSKPVKGKKSDNKADSKKESNKKNKNSSTEKEAIDNLDASIDDTSKATDKNALKKSNTKEKKGSTKELSANKVSDNNDSSTLTVLNNINRQLSVNKTEIVAALLQSLEPINNQIALINGEISKSRTIATENESLKLTISNLHLENSKQKSMLEKAEGVKNELLGEINGLKAQLSTLEAKNKELDDKLNEAYSLNSRESSLEAEKVRLELKKAFEFLYEDWLEYEFSNVNEDNYLSLQAIIKKTFRALERNGINFKESIE